MNKTVQLKVAFVMLLFMQVAILKAQDNSIGVAIKGATSGIGGDIVYSFHPKMDVRVGFETLSFSRDFSFDEQDISYDAIADVKAGNISAIYDYYVANIFFVSAGFGFNLFNADISGEAASSLAYGDIEIPKEEIGDFDFQVEPGLKISPYLGVGLGRALGIDSKLAASFELGMFYQGSPQLTINTSGLLSPTSNPEHGHKELLENQVKQYTIYPVARLSVSYRFLDF